MMFDKMKELMQLRSQMARIKKELDEVVIERISADDLIKISISGSQEVSEVKINGDLTKYDVSQLENILKDVINDAIKSSQREAANRMGQASSQSMPEA
jgi:DNA-binding protein YbaB